MNELQLASDQLMRMRAMTGMYHRRFFADIWLTTLTGIGLVVLGFSLAPEIFLLVPFVALIGANQTAFDASYLMFARHYAFHLETFLNRATRYRVLVASELESAYLFPLSQSKVVTVPIRGPFTWFSWMTILYTTIGILVGAASLALGWDALVSAGAGWTTAYLVALALLVLLSLFVGVWWFVGGVGERRLEAVLDSEFGADARGS